MLRSFEDLQSFARLARQYRSLREVKPQVPARYIVGFLRSDEALTLEQYLCSVTTGHRWAYTGTAYGGDDERYHGEGRCYCSHCGADGDA
jgi:hypothetical protein